MSTHPIATDRKLGQREFRKCSVLVDDVARDGWNEVLTSFEDASIYQTWEYGSVRWGEKNLSRVIVVDGDGRPVSAAQVRIVQVPVVGAGIGYVFYGPMWKARGMQRNVEAFRAGLRALIDEYVRSRGLLLRLRPYGFERLDDDMKEVLRQEGLSVTHGLQREQRQTILVDVTASEEQLKRRLRKTWRASLRQAEKANLEVTESFDSQALESLKPVLNSMIERKKFTPGSSIQEYSTLQECLPAGMKMRVTICRAGGEIVAGEICSSIGNAVIGLMAATSPAGRRVQAYYLLQWEEILWAKMIGKPRVDLGGINPVNNPGGYVFKSGLGGMQVTALGVYDFSNRDLVYNAMIGVEVIVHWLNVLRRKRKQP